MSAGGGGPGAKLAAARTARGMSPVQAAEQMRLTAAAVLAMEEGRYQDLGPPVFARGHLRKYAALVGVPAEELLAAYEAAAPHAGEPDLTPPASLHTPMRSPRVALPAWQVWMIAVATLLAVGIGAWWMWQARSGPGPAGTTAPRAEEAAPADGPSSQPAPPPADADSVPPAVPGRESPGDGQLPQSGPVAPSRSGGLTLRFAGPCWLEVYDAAGTRLAFELAQTGAVRSFNGTPPWRVVLGAARSVQLSVDGSAVTIPASLVVRDAALISISGRGEVARTPAGTMQNS